MKRHRSTSPNRGKTGEAGASRAKAARDLSGPTVVATAANSSTSNSSGNETTAINNSTFLSKNALYTPLLAYDQAKVEPSLYLGTKSSIPNSIQETSLVNFLRTVSLEYHYQPSASSVVDPSTTGNNNNNNSNHHLPPYLSHRNDCKFVGGSQAVALSKIEERIRQRTVTLLGGGIHVTAAKLKATALKLEKNQQRHLGGLGRRRRRQHRQRQLLHRQNLTGDNGNTTTLHNLPSDANPPVGEDQASSPPSHQQYHQLDFVRELNTAWNEYFIQALSAFEWTTGAARNTKVATGTGDDSTALLWRTRVHHFFAASSSSLELVGAHVQVLSCAQRLSLVHQKGVLVGQTQNTWTVAMVPPRTRPRRPVGSKTKKVEQEEESNMSNANHGGARKETCNDTSSPPIMLTKQQQQEQPHTWTAQSVMIPKRGTSIGILLRIPSTNSPNSLDPHSTTMTATVIPTIIPNSHSPTLCIVVQPPTTYSVSLLKR